MPPRTRPVNCRLANPAALKHHVTDAAAVFHPDV